MHKSQRLFYLTTALNISGVTITYLQEHKTTVTTASGNRYTVLSSAAIVEELELIVTPEICIAVVRQHIPLYKSEQDAHVTDFI